MFESNLFLIDDDAIWLNREVLPVMPGICLIPVTNRYPGSADAELLVLSRHSANDANAA